MCIQLSTSPQQDIRIGIAITCYILPALPFLALLDRAILFIDTHYA